MKCNISNLGVVLECFSQNELILRSLSSFEMTKTGFQPCYDCIITITPADQ